jgi:hypothetical protein
MLKPMCVKQSPGFERLGDVLLLKLALHGDGLFRFKKREHAGLCCIATDVTVSSRQCVLLAAVLLLINPLKPNDPNRGRTAPLTSKRSILYIYSTNIGTEYFKHSIYSPFFSSSKCCLFHNSNIFGSCLIHILYTGCAKIKKKINSGAKRLKHFGTVSYRRS